MSYGYNNQKSPGNSGRSVDSLFRNGGKSKDTGEIEKNTGIMNKPTVGFQSDIHRRKSLNKVTPDMCDNSSLWFHKYDHPDRSPGQSERTDDGILSVMIPVPDEYASFYDFWKRLLKEDQGACLFEGKVLGRMAVGMGNESVFENSITLHRTYGVPYIPGSALKGLTAHYARNHLDGMEKTSEIYEAVFGSGDNAGFVTFFDALYIPGSSKNIDNNGKDLPLKNDIITPHHQEYNSGNKTKKGDVIPPAEYDDPVPIPFISSVGSYLIAIAGPEKLVFFVSEIMKMALKEEGIGSKTSSGYGRINLSSSE